MPPTKVMSSTCPDVPAPIAWLFISSKLIAASAPATPANMADSVKAWKRTRCVE